ncbi:hypothetical protein SAMN04488029_1073 [Reichenbachiella faecimaris]|uniref:Uncharacterized protein n=1 Tax=Reichenbachiella faecimaris TaxID=692418 RepID=A0A1W2G8G4_REIFA|nr:hypothetical protein [Reichenbachiella faecimaris]SMD32722.1 hypothetical protein SAMN04488029_1073 [Reichenbachiella faecimaris]
MIYIIPTKKGIGVELWGTYGDLNIFHQILGKFWNDENASKNLGFENRDLLLSSFSYEIRKAKDSYRLKREENHLYPHEIAEYFGARFSWVHILFSMSAMKYNMQFYETNKLDIAMILQLDFWLEKAMNSYDDVGAKKLTPFINDVIHGSNEYIYQCMRTTNLEYFLLGGGKRAFRKLPELLRRGVYYTDEYDNYHNELEEDAKRLNCKASELDINDDHIDYEGIKW